MRGLRIPFVRIRNQHIHEKPVPKKNKNWCFHGFALFTDLSVHLTLYISISLRLLACEDFALSYAGLMKVGTEIPWICSSSSSSFSISSNWSNIANLKPKKELILLWKKKRSSKLIFVKNVKIFPLQSKYKRFELHRILLSKFEFSKLLM